jgi:hypothetical protein
MLRTDTGYKSTQILLRVLLIEFTEILLIEFTEILLTESTRVLLI